MDLKEAKSRLFSTTFILGHFQQKAALRYLKETAETGAMDILAEALDGGIKTVQVLEILSSVRDGARLDRLWQLWAKGRSEKLGALLKEKGTPAGDEALRPLSLLKIGRPGDISSDQGDMRKVFEMLGDADTEVQKSASWYLGKTAGTAVMDILAEALDGGIRTVQVLEILSSVQDVAKMDRLWQLWAQGRSEKLGALLKEKGTPAGDEALRPLSLLKIGRPGDISSDQGDMRKVFEMLGDSDTEVRRSALRYLGKTAGTAAMHILKPGDISSDRGGMRRVFEMLGYADSAVQQEVVAYARMLPLTEEAADSIYEAWLKFGSQPLEAVIRTQDRKPSNPSLEALFLLLDNQFEKYLALENERGERFQEVYALAPEAFRVRLNEAVIRSGSRRLADAYEKALGGRSDFSSELFIKARAAAGDDEGLFEAAKYMTLAGLLDLCKRWSENGWRPPRETRQRGLVERAVAAYGQVGSLEIEAAGTSDLFVSWRKLNLSAIQIAAGLDDPDPFVRMRSLYLGAMGNLLPAGRLESAARSADWPERLATRLFRGEAATGKDHVAWLNACAGSGDLLTVPVNCTPDEYEYFGRILQATQENARGLAGRYRALVEILHAFQSVHAAWRIVVGDDDSAEERGAVQVADLEEAPGEVEF